MSFGLEVFKSSGALKVSAQSRGFNVRFASSVHLENVNGQNSKQVALPEDFDASFHTLHVFFALGYRRSDYPVDVPVFYVPYSYSVNTTEKTVTVSLDLPANAISTISSDFAILVTN